METNLMKTPTWIRNADATVPELKEQLSCAKKAYADAEAAVDAALADFDAKPSSSTENALAQAREDAQSVRELVGRAERLLAAANEREKAKSEAEARREKASLDAELNGPMKKREAELAEAEADAFVQVVNARLARRQHNELVAAARNRHRVLSLRLSPSDGGYEQMLNSIEPGTFEIGRLLHSKARAIAASDPRHDWLMAIALEFAPNV